MQGREEYPAQKRDDWKRRKKKKERKEPFQHTRKTNELEDKALKSQKQQNLKAVPTMSSLSYGTKTHTHIHTHTQKTQCKLVHTITEKIRKQGFHSRPKH
jgi:hypothetical protein